MIRIGAQIYTVRELLKNDEMIKDTLYAIREIGYDSIQLFGSPELIEKCAGAARAASLTICGTLANMSICQSQETEFFDVCRKYRIPDIAISSNPDECEQTEHYISQVNAFAARVRQEGFSFSYHNHGHEFIRFDGRTTAMDKFLRGFDAETVEFMPDTYWIQEGGCDVRHFLEQTRNRVRFLHLKDMKRTAQGHAYAELGNGNLYLSGILKTALACGIRHFIVEQDICEGNPLDSLRQSYTYLMRLLEE